MLAIVPRPTPAALASASLARSTASAQVWSGSFARVLIELTTANSSLLSRVPRGPARRSYPLGLVAVPQTKNTVSMRMSDALRRAEHAAHATGRAFRSGTHASGKATRGTGRFVHRITGAQGAGRTGLATLIETTAVSGAADAFVTIALAGTIFFSTSVDQARGRVVLFLIITIAPFAVLAPFIGPALDRIQQGRRFVLAGTMLARGLLCYAMSANVANSVTLLPAAFGILVLQKAGGVVKASVTPRLLPAEITLVKANARSGLISLAASTVAAVLAAGGQFAGGAAWTLRVGTLIYLAAMVLALRLPEQIDIPAAAAAPSPDPRPAPAPGEARIPGEAREARPRQETGRARHLALGRGRRLLPVRATTTRQGRPPVRATGRAARCRWSRARSRPPTDTALAATTLAAAAPAEGGGGRSPASAPWSPRRWR